MILMFTVLDFYDFLTLITSQLRILLKKKRNRCFVTVINAVKNKMFDLEKFNLKDLFKFVLLH